MVRNQMSWYCDIAPGHPVHGYYHDHEYGFPIAISIKNDDILLERLALEIMQAGLSWEIVLKKRAGLYKAFDGFQVKKVAKYGDKKVAELLQNPEIIRNKLKVNAIIHNANMILNMQKTPEIGSFGAFLASHHPRGHLEWQKLFKKTFKFTGGEIVKEFLMSLGYLPGAHHEKCSIYSKISKKSPPWMK